MDRDTCRGVDAEITALYVKGVPVKEIAELLGVSYSRIYAAIRRCGVEPMRRGTRRLKRLTREEIHAIIKMYREGETVYGIARRLGRAPSTVYYALKRLGLLDNRGDGEARIGEPRL